MSEELTEQWREGGIQEAYYYVKCPWSEGEVDIRYVHNGVDDWKEIIAPVPIYDQFVGLTEKVKELSSENGRLQYDNDVLSTVYDELFKRFERLQKKLDVAIATLELLEVKSDKFNSSMGLVEQLDDIKADCQATLHHLKETEEL